MKPYILIVDSDLSAAQVTWAGVKRAVPDASLAIEPTPERALLSLQHRRPDVLIIDPPCHTMATDRLIRELKEASPETPVIVLASAPSVSLQRDMRRLGVDVYLQKPSPLAPMLDALRSALEIRPTSEPV